VTLVYRPPSSDPNKKYVHEEIFEGIEYISGLLMFNYAIYQPSDRVKIIATIQNELIRSNTEILWRVDDGLPELDRLEASFELSILKRHLIAISNKLPSDINIEYDEFIHKFSTTARTRFMPFTCVVKSLKGNRYTLLQFHSEEFLLAGQELMLKMGLDLQDQIISIHSGVVPQQLEIV
jgi:hypothetical protein